MAICPKCQTDLGEQDFGLIECPNCSASLMIQMDGSVAAHTDEPPPPPPAGAEPLDDSNSLSDQLLDDLSDDSSGGGEADRMLADPDNWSTDGVQDGPLMEEAPEGLDKSFATGEIPSIGESTTGVEETVEQLNDPALDQQEDENFDGMLGDVEEILNEGIDTSMLEDSEPAMQTDSAEPQAQADEFEDLDPSDVQEEYESEEDYVDTNEPSSRDDYSEDGDHYDGQYEQGEEVYSSQEEANVDEIADYGNSEASQKGTILYSLVIGSIDSKQMREEVRGVLSDKRLMLNVEELLGDIENGELTIAGLSSVKTFVLVSQLIGMTVSLKWRQHVQANP